MGTQTHAVAPPQPEVDGWNVVAEEELVPLHATVISTDLNPVTQRLVEFERDGLALGARIGGIIELGVKDQDTYNCAAALITEGKAFVKTTDDFFEPIRSITFALYNRVLGRKKGVQSPVADRLKPLAGAIIYFEREQEELRQREERRLAEEQRKAEEERKLQAAAAAEKADMDETSVQQILDAPSVAPAPAAAPTFQRAAGVSRREAWCAEVLDLHALVKAVAKDKKLLPLLEANMPALNAQARAMKTALAIPGVRAVDKGSVAVRA